MKMISFESVIITLEEVKDYCRIEQDFKDDDERLLEPFIMAAEGYLEGHIGTEIFEALLIQPKNLAKAKIYCLALVDEWYDNRGNNVVSQGLEKTLAKLGSQLKYGVVLPVVQ